MNVRTFYRTFYLTTSLIVFFINSLFCMYLLYVNTASKTGQGQNVLVLMLNSLAKCRICTEP